jgi:hypothetical protein
MALIQLEGSTEILQGLVDIEGLTLMPATTEPIGVARWRVGGYASDEAVETLRARGATVLVAMTSNEVLGARREQQEEIKRGRIARGEA